MKKEKKIEETLTQKFLNKKNQVNHQLNKNKIFTKLSEYLSKPKISKPFNDWQLLYSFFLFFKQQKLPILYTCQLLISEPLQI